MRTGDMTQWFRIPEALEEIMGSVFSTHMVTHYFLRLEFEEIWRPLVAFTCTVYTQGTCINVFKTLIHVKIHKYILKIEIQISLIALNI